MPTDFLSPWRGLRIHFLGLFLRSVLDFAWFGGAVSSALGQRNCHTEKPVAFVESIFIYFAVFVSCSPWATL